jgi:hypothetical protein
MNKAFVINLAAHEAAFIEVQQAMLPYGLECERFVVTPDEHKQIGCTISHLELIAQAKEKGWPYLIVLEDDCDVREAMKAWPAIFQYLFQHRNRWDIFLGGAMYIQPKKLHLDFKPKTTLGIEMVECLHAVTAHFIIYNDTSYDRLLRWNDLPEPMEQRPILDHFFDQCHLKIWTTSPGIAWQKPHHGHDPKELFEHAENKLHYFTHSLRNCLKYRLFGRWLKTIQ